MNIEIFYTRDDAWVFWDSFTVLLMYNHAAIPYLGGHTLVYLGVSFLGAHSYLMLSSMHFSAIENCSPNGLFGTLKAEKNCSCLVMFNPVVSMC